MKSSLPCSQETTGYSVAKKSYKGWPMHVRFNFYFAGCVLLNLLQPKRKRAQYSGCKDSTPYFRMSCNGASRTVSELSADQYPLFAVFTWPLKKVKPHSYNKLAVDRIYHYTMVHKTSYKPVLSHSIVDSLETETPGNRLIN
jgi:hypothetical protein